MQCSMVWSTSKQPCHEYIWIGGGELINQPSNKKKQWNGKLIERLLLTVIMAYLEWFTSKSKPVTYTGVFIKFYN